MAQGSRGRMRRPTFRETVERNHRSLDFMAAMAGKPPLEKSIVFAPKRAYAKRSSGSEGNGPLEKDVLAAVGDYLAAHPNVLLAVRQNSGAMHYESQGRTVPVWFYKLVRRGDKDVTLTDFWGFLRDGRPFAIEAKRPSWRGVSDERERKQEAFIHLVEAIGGVGGFVRSVEEAQGILQ